MMEPPHKNHLQYPAWERMTGNILLALVVIAIIAGMGSISRAETYACTEEGHEEARCTVDYGREKDNIIVFLCKKESGGAVEEKTCSAVYSPTQGYTYTGMPGRNWVCDSKHQVLHGEFADKKAMCAKLCGICAGFWK